LSRTGGKGVLVGTSVGVIVAVGVGVGEGVIVAVGVRVGAAGIVGGNKSPLGRGGCTCTWVGVGKIKGISVGVAVGRGVLVGSGVLVGGTVGVGSCAPCPPPGIAVGASLPQPETTAIIITIIMPT